MGKKQHFSKSYAKEQLEKKFNRDGISATVGKNKEGLGVTLNNKEDKTKVPKAYYGYPIKVRVVSEVSRRGRVFVF